ncbi:hypothetical protein EV188_101836 [Actinomycetospora succinea]|uniref:Uncharacterized protein n=1 Tax=Actinomycetospora succinea TaxID=663603 RepID=A0A4R6VSJ2_9PSEU|nr:hypothetical protein EV188_101836 [Actinomycetospora succinea]
MLARATRRGGRRRRAPSRVPEIKGVATHPDQRRRCMTTPLISVARFEGAVGAPGASKPV